MVLTQRIAVISIITSITILALKFIAYFLTNSLGFFSDALESFVNVFSSILAFIVLTIAAKPADEKHQYGHDKAEYFASGVEGALILVAAITIIYSALMRLYKPQLIHGLNGGLIASLIATLLNFLLAMFIKRASAGASITLFAHAEHILVDVWTSAGVMVSLLVVQLMGPQWQILDPLTAIAVAIHILKTGFDLVQQSLDGLMDACISTNELSILEAVIKEHLPSIAAYHSLKTRQSGPRRFIEFKLLVPGNYEVFAAHQLCDKLEQEIAYKLDNCIITIHVEPIKD